LLVRLVNLAPPWELALDRTDWKLGRAHLNVLLLSIVVAKTRMAFPLLWSVLEKAEGTGKAGASHTGERTDLLARFVHLFGAASIACLYADREFVGAEWVSWLLSHRIAFCLRIKADTLIEDSRGALVCADWLFRELALTNLDQGEVSARAARRVRAERLCRCQADRARQRGRFSDRDQ
jgi:hypothetical protein